MIYQFKCKLEVTQTDPERDATLNIIGQDSADIEQLKLTVHGMIASSTNKSDRMNEKRNSAANTICKNYTTGTCKHGDRCFYQHPTPQENSRRQTTQHPRNRTDTQETSYQPRGTYRDQDSSSQPRGNNRDQDSSSHQAPARIRSRSPLHNRHQQPRHERNRSPHHNHYNSGSWPEDRRTH
jgi:hypothetical protein